MLVNYLLNNLFAGDIQKHHGKQVDAQYIQFIENKKNCIYEWFLIATSNFSFLFVGSTDLNLPYPKMIDVAVPANMVCGLQDLESKAS